MKFSQNVQDALKQPDTKAIVNPLTPEAKERIKKVADEVMNLIEAKTSGPMEGYCLLQILMHGMEECYGIRGGIIMENSDGQS